MKNYKGAKIAYSKFGVDTDAAMAILRKVPISIHCWQGDDVSGFDSKEALSGGGSLTFYMMMLCYTIYPNSHTYTMLINGTTDYTVEHIEGYSKGNAVKGENGSITTVSMATPIRK